MSENEIVERVRKAICCKNGRCEAAGEPYDPIAGRVKVCLAGTFDGEARAAIAAMPITWPPMRPMAEAPMDGTRVLVVQIARLRRGSPNSEIIVRWEASARAWRGDNRSLWGTTELDGWHPLPPLSDQPKTQKQDSGQ